MASHRRSCAPESTNFIPSDVKRRLESLTVEVDELLCKQRRAAQHEWDRLFTAVRSGIDANDWPQLRAVRDGVARSNLEGKLRALIGPAWLAWFQGISLDRSSASSPKTVAATPVEPLGLYGQLNSQPSRTPAEAWALLILRTGRLLQRD